MAALSDYLETELINAALRGQAFTSPSTIYLALFTTATEEDGSGTEMAGRSYARQAIAFDPPNNGAVANSDQIVFLDLPGGNVTHVALYDAETDGNMLFHGPMTAAKVVNESDSLTVAPGAVIATLA